jgi:hypothetical protein
MLLRSDDARFTVVLPRTYLEALVARCARAGRNETGGILVGFYSADGECATVTAIGSAPEDSDSGGTWFRRGVRGIAEWLSALWKEARPTYYLGEWHFHPFASATASGEDVEQLRTIARDRRYRCPEPILIIVGGNPKARWQIAAYVATPSKVINLRER